MSDVSKYAFETDEIQHDANALPPDLYNLYLKLEYEMEENKKQKDENDKVEYSLF